MTRRGPCEWIIAGAVAWLIAGCSPRTGAPPDAPPGSTPGRSQIEREVLADGQVTFAELERAAFSFVECMERELGIEGNATYRDDAASFVFDFHDPTNQMEERLAGTADEACEAEIDDITSTWTDQQERATPERDRYQLVVECLRARGHQVASADPAELSRANAAYPEDYRECFDVAFPTPRP